MYFRSPDNSGQEDGNFEGTFQDTKGNTIFVLSFDTPDYGTLYVLITPESGEIMGDLSDQALINEFTANRGVDGLTTTPLGREGHRSRAIARILSGSPSGIRKEAFASS